MLKGTQTNGRSIALHVALLSELLRHLGTGQLRLDLFTVSCLVIWPLNESEAGIDLYRSYINDVALMLINWNLSKKSSEISTKTRSVPASLSFIGQVTEHIICESENERVIHFEDDWNNCLSRDATILANIGELVSCF